MTNELKDQLKDEALEKAEELFKALEAESNEAVQERLLELPEYNLFREVFIRLGME